MKKLFYLIVGCLSLVTGIAGIVLPIVPTTPLLLLAGFCFARSSKKFEVWLRNSKIYDFYVADYAETKSIPRERKKKMIWQIYLLMGISIFLAPFWFIKLGLFIGTAIGTYVLFQVVPDK
ncbi:YbaN family protein [Streptococcus thoraltensis]|uniref:YbaN family protein n=1 Tax=Streptococcus thoraltensis TaxID=55085 RepID=UPI00035D301E|nr:YbaN family protein [Streptococcus thoraltensis]MDY4760682.1 YbaN family protein [Streptococcus thoraltensis]